MSGLRLKKMEASEMVDVLHFLYEEDVMPTIENGPEIQSKIREMLYDELYKRPYKYKVTPQQQRQDGLLNADGSPARPEFSDLPPERQPVKPFIPATDPEFFDQILGQGPMGGPS